MPKSLAFKVAYQLLQKILGNIVKSPQDDRYKSIKPSNATLKAKLFGIKEMGDLLQSLGFQYIDDAYIYLGDEYVLLDGFTLYLQSSMSTIGEKYLSTEELNRRKEVEKRQKEIDAEYKKKKDEEDKLKELMKLDRKEKAKDEKAKDSIAKQRQFGTKATSYKDIGIDLCAQKKGG